MIYKKIYKIIGKIFIFYFVLTMKSYAFYASPSCQNYCQKISENYGALMACEQQCEDPHSITDPRGKNTSFNDTESSLFL